MERSRIKCEKSAHGGGRGWMDWLKEAFRGRFELTYGTSGRLQR